MSKLYAYSRTMAGAARLAQQRGLPAAITAPPKQERAPAAVPEPNNVVQLMIPRTEAQRIIADIAHEAGLTYADLIGPRWFRHIIPVRDKAMAAVRALSNGERSSFSLPMLGRLFGGRDHTTILAALRRHAKRGA